MSDIKQKLSKYLFKRSTPSPIAQTPQTTTTTCTSSDIDTGK